MDVVSGRDVKLLLGRITFDLFCHDEFKTLWESLSCPAHSNRQRAFLVSSTRVLIDISFPFPSHYSDRLSIFLFLCYPALLWSHPSLYPVY